MRMMLPRRKTIKFVASKGDVHPSLHIVPTGMSVAQRKLGNRCAFLAGSGTPGGRRRLHVCVDVAMQPSGNLTEIGVSVGRRLVWGVAKEM